MSAVATKNTVLGPIDNTQNRFCVEFVVTLTGNYGGASTHGDTLDLSTLGAQSAQLPTEVQLFEASPAGAVPSGNIFRFMPGTTQANGVLSIFTAAGAEYTQASAYGTPPFAIVGFTLRGRAWFQSFL